MQASATHPPRPAPCTPSPSATLLVWRWWWGVPRTVAPTSGNTWVGGSRVKAGVQQRECPPPSPPNSGSLLPAGWVSRHTHGCYQDGAALITAPPHPTPLHPHVHVPGGGGGDGTQHGGTCPPHTPRTARCWGGGAVCRSPPSMGAGRMEGGTSSPVGGWVWVGGGCDEGETVGRGVTPPPPNVPAIRSCGFATVFHFGTKKKN